MASKNKGDLIAKEGGVDMKSHKTSDDITKAGKTKKRNAELMKRTEAVEAEPGSIIDPLDEERGNNDGDFKLFSDWSKKASFEDKKLRGRRLGIFGFGSRAEKLPDAQG